MGVCGRVGSTPRPALRIRRNGFRAWGVCVDFVVNGE